MTERRNSNSFDFTTGASVHCRDGSAGTLRMVVADPHTRRVTDLIVEKGNRQKQDRVLPVSVVERTTESDVYLTINSGELSRYPRYREEEMTAPLADWKGDRYCVENVRYRLSPYGAILSGSVVPMIRYQVQEGVAATVETLERGTPVYGQDGRIGTVDHILAEPDSGDISHLVVQRRMSDDYRVIPIELVENLREVGITVNASADDVAAMSRYEPRARRDTLSELQNRFAAASEAEPSDAKVDLDAGVAQLTGVVSGPVAKGQAERLARSVDGVIDVDNVLDTDPTIVERVLLALQHDPRTRAADIGVESALGIVTLTGRVPSTATRDAAQEIARRQDGVRAVKDHLTITSNEQVSNQ